MLKSKILPTFLLLLFSISVQAQDKYDLIDCLYAIFDDPELEPVFVMDMDFGKGAVIISGDSKGGFGLHDERRLLEMIEDYDLDRLNYPVKIMTAEEFRSSGMSDTDGGLVYMGFTIDNRSMSCNLMSHFPNSKKVLQGAYSLEKERGEWQIKNKSVKFSGR